MRSWSVTLALLALVLLATPPLVRAEDEVEEDFDEGEDMEEMEYMEEGMDEPEMSGFRPADIRTTVIFPDHEGGKPFIAGEPVTALVGVWNAGDEPYNLSYCGASFHSPYDYSYFIQNFTVQQPNAMLAPQTQKTLEYKFTPDASLEAVDFWLSGWVIYNDTEGQLYRSVWTNGTVTLEEKASEVNARLAFVFIVIIALVALFCYLIYDKVVNSKSAKKKRAVAKDAVAPEEVAPAAADDDWGEVYPIKTTTHSSSKKAGKKKD
eukprot:gb/GEZN01009721.1/.p1 GENE.gb/GEZN01009721.1/~~gb/GEZN01009721.1/.p1  ORF type:complete len:264 (+),score=68.85 gb/GEZN01009721.1/:40-831(+)